MGLSRTIGNIIAIILACLWTYASQAHFTAKLTSELAAGVDESTRTLHRAFESTGFSVNEVSSDALHDK